MSRTVTALFDTRADAEAGRNRLMAANVDADNVQIMDSSMANADDGYSTQERPGMWGSVKNAFLPDEDRHTYEEGVRRGGCVLTADVDEDEVDMAVRALEETNSVDMDERSQKWKSEGWDYAPPATGRSAMFGNDTQASTTTGTDRMTANTGGEERLQVVEEQLVVGKRETERGGVRVRSYVTEKPMHEQIRLREEHVNVERRPVDQPLSTATGDAFNERTIEMSETSEEAVVTKNARVVEEVVVSKTAGERVEEINETVRRTDVEVENIGGTGTSTDRDSMNRDNMSRTAGTTGTTGTGDSLSGMGNEAIGNAKQGLGGLTGSDNLQQSGQAQERKGEMQQGKGPDKY